MSRIRRITAALLFGILMEVALWGISSGLFHFSYRREPMDDPFSWTGIMLHQPGVAISARYGAAPGGVDFLLIGGVQTVLWACAAFAFFSWRARTRQEKQA
jgi:hypothetical protein